MKDIEQTLGFVPGFMKALPEDSLVQEWPSFKQYELGETEIPGKYKELIELAVAASIKCPYCQHFHLGAAKMKGATPEELSELATIASMTTRWSTIIHAQNYDYEAFKKEFKRIKEHMEKSAAPQAIPTR